MDDKELYYQYYNWLIIEAIPDMDVRNRYSKLMDKLFNTLFYYSISLDENREQDGRNLRYLFGYYNNIEYGMINRCIDIRQSSLLEMMLALAKKCEDEIMEDSDIGNRTPIWFWAMLESIGISNMDDINYNDIFVSYKIDRLLNRQYEPDGEGGLFTVRDTLEDLRKIEIWTQMNLYLNSLSTTYNY